MENGFFDFVLPWLENEFNFIIPFLIGLFVFYLRGERQSRVFVFWLFVVMASAFVVNSKIVKKVVKRVRPHHTYAAENVNLRLGGHEVPPPDDYSFPSGHSAFVFAVVLFIVLYFPRWWIGIVAYLFALTVGFSRVYLGPHYPLDVVGGFVVGSGVALAVFFLEKKIRDQSWFEKIMNLWCLQFSGPPRTEGDVAEEAQ